MKITCKDVSVDDSKKPKFPLLVSCHEDNSILMFLTETTAILLAKGDCDDRVGHYYEKCFNLFENLSDCWTILPEGFEINLTQNFEYE